MSPEQASKLLEAGIQAPPSKQYLATGCEKCDMTGYKGRVGIYEMLTLDDPIRSVVRSGGRNDEIRALARHNGMRQMQEYALDLVCQGETTLEEILRVVPFEQIFSEQCGACQRDLSPAFVFCPYCGERRSDGGLKKSQGGMLVSQGARIE